MRPKILSAMDNNFGQPSGIWGCGDELRALYWRPHLKNCLTNGLPLIASTKRKPRFGEVSDSDLLFSLFVFRVSVTPFAILVGATPRLFADQRGRNLRQPLPLRMSRLNIHLSV